MHLAAQHGFLDIVQLLIHHGSNWETPSPHGLTPLFISSANGHIELANYFVERGAPMNFEVAVALNDQSRVQQYLNSGQKINTPGTLGLTALHIAASRGLVTMGSFLLANGAHIDARDLDKNTPLHLATQEGHLPFVKLLMAQGADLSAKDPEGRLPLDWAKIRNHQEIVQLLRNTTSLNNEY